MMDPRVDLLHLPPPDTELQRFAELQGRLPELWRAVHASLGTPHTSIVVPSLSFDADELRKIDGVASYEERMLFALIRLRHPQARVLYVTSQPVNPDIVDYYLTLLSGIPAGHARRRLGLLNLSDDSPTPLTQRILERPRVIERMRTWIGDPSRAYLTCFNSTRLEQRLAVALGVPLNASDPALLGWGTKTGSRRAFEIAGVPHPEGVVGVRERRDVVDALTRLGMAPTPPRRAVVKLDDSFSGEGNAVFTYPRSPPRGSAALREVVEARLDDLAWTAPDETAERYFGKLASMGGVVEAFVEGDDAHSPSVQMRIAPTGELQLVSTHDQILGGATGQVYLGCRFPADPAYRALISREALKVGAVLRELGVVSRFAIDFLVTHDAQRGWRAHALEINLRMGGTTHPFLGLQFVTGGALDPSSGEFRTPRGEPRCYVATDALKSPSYRGLLAEDLMDILVAEQLQFSPTTEKGTLFHMIGAMSRYGKVGVTCIGDTPEEAQSVYQATVSSLDRATGAAHGEGGEPARFLDRRVVDME